MNGSLPRQRLLRNRLFYPAVVALAIVAVISVILLVSAALQAQVTALGALILLILFAASMVTALATTQVIPWNRMTWHHVRQPRVLGAVGSIMLVSFSALYSFLPLLQTKGGVDAAINEMQGLLREVAVDSKAARSASEKGLTIGADTNKRVTEFGSRIANGQNSLVERRINGLWGRNDCATTYRFILEPAGGQTRTLTMRSEKSEQGLTDFLGVFVYKGAADLVGNDGFARSVLSTEEEQGFDQSTPGYVVDFTLVSSGANERLIWASKNPDQNAVTLIRCPDRAQDSGQVAT
jgi:hypothetical protein